MFVRVLFQECKPGTIEGLTRKAEETLIGPVRGIPGFVSYRIAKVDDRTMIAMGVFESREGAEELNRIGAEWRKEYGKDSIVSVRSSMIGEVLLDAQPSGVDTHAIH